MDSITQQRRALPRLMPTVAVPDDDVLEEMVMDFGDVETTDGCCGVEPDGYCEHGYPSWLIELGLI